MANYKLQIQVHVAYTKYGTMCKYTSMTVFGFIFDINEKVEHVFLWSQLLSVIMYKQMPITFDNQVKKALFGAKPIFLVTIFQYSPAALNMC